MGLLQKTILIGNNTTGITAADRYLPITAAGNVATSSAVTAQCVIPGKASQTWLLQRFFLNIDTAAGATCTWTVEVNGSLTGIIITMGAAVVSGNDVLHNTFVNGGDVISIHRSVSGGGTSVNSGVVRWCIEAIGETQPVMATTNGNVDNTVTTWFPIMGADNDTTAIGNMTCVMPTGGTIRNAQMVLNGTPGAGKQYVVTMKRNGSTAGCPTMTCASLATSASDLSSSIHVSQDDQVVWECVPTGTPTARNIAISFEFVPDTPGETILCFTSATLQQATSDRFWQLLGGANTQSTTEAPRQTLINACYLKKLTVLLSTNPGAAASGKKYQYFIYDNGSVVGTPTCTVTEIQTTAHDNSTVYRMAESNPVSFQLHPIATPTQSSLSLSIVAFVPPFKVGERGRQQAPNRASTY